MNARPYTGDGHFLAGPTARTAALWRRLPDTFEHERERGIR